MKSINVCINSHIDIAKLLSVCSVDLINNAKEIINTIKTTIPAIIFTIIPLSCQLELSYWQVL